MGLQEHHGEGNREIMRILGALREEVGLQEKLIGQLRERLSPIMSSTDTRADGPPGNIPSAPQTPLGELLQQNVNDMRQANKVLQLFVNQVQL